jgi:uncharacterized DUF497 family protein
MNIYMKIDLERITGFDWDDGNRRKSADKHDVSQAEAESIFLNDPLLVVEDSRHSAQEPRLNALGKTGQGRFLHITFTLRHHQSTIRVISARDMNRKERNIYEPA